MMQASRWLGSLFLGTVFALSAKAQEVREVRIENRGTVPVEASSVRPFLAVTEGDALDALRVMQDVDRLRETQRYRQVEADVEVDPEGADVIYGVSAKPRISRIRVYGADRLRTDRLRDELGIAVGDLADESDLAAALKRIRAAYVKRGFPDAGVTGRIEDRPDEGTAEIRIDVVEGLRGRVVAYDFRGNEAFTDASLRRGLLQRRRQWYKPWHWLRLGSSRYDEIRVEEDMHRVRRRYLDAGHLDARIEEPEIERMEGRGLRLVLPVNEGPQYTLGRISIEGIMLYPADDIRGALDLSAGDEASYGALERAADAVVEYYGTRGHPGVSVEPRLVPGEVDAVVDVTFAVTERPKAQIRDVHIRGHVITRDRVMRRELAVRPGDEYNRARIRTSERRLQNLGYFSSVQTRMDPTGAPDEYDLVFDVEEQRMGQAALGLGFSSIDSISGFFEVSHGNVDLFAWPPFGDGQKLRLRGTAGTRRSDAEISFIEPYFLGRRLSLGVDLFHRERRYLSREFDQRDTGGRVSLTQQVGPFSRATLAYGLERIELRNVSEEASPIFKEEEGARLKSSVTVSISHDTRDQFRIPTRGHRASASATIAGGALQGDTDLYALNLRGVRYVPLWWRHVLVIRADAGVVEEYGRSDRVPFFDRHFLGGADTIRAFRYRDVGPRDERGDVIGGRTMALASVEYVVPIVDMIRAAVFYDVGMAWADAYRFDSHLNSGYGVGLRLDIPMMPLRFDYAWPLEADELNDRSSGRFSFYVGYGF